jgi:hypothetical protein
MVNLCSSGVTLSGLFPKISIANSEAVVESTEINYMEKKIMGT